METADDLFRTYKAHPTREGLVRLLRDRQDTVYNICFQILGNRHDAEDAAQNTFLKILDGIREISDAGHFQRWVYRVALTTSLDLARSRQRRELRERDHVVNPTDPSAAAAVHEHLGRLDDDLREVIVEHHFEQRTLEEMGRRRGVSAVAIWKRLQRATEELKRSLATAGLAMVVPDVDGILTSIRPVNAPTDLVTGVVLAKAGTIAAGGIAIAMKTKVATFVVAMIAMAGLAGMAGHLRGETMRSQPVAATGEIRKLRAGIEALEAEAERLAAEKLALQEKKTARVERPSKDPVATAPRTGLDWDALQAAFDWKGLAERRAVGAKDPKENQATWDLMQKGVQLCKKALDGGDPTRFDDGYFVAILCLLQGWSETHPNLKPELEKARADIDRLFADPDAMLMENYLKGMDIGLRILEHARQFAMDDANVALLQREPNRGVSLSPASDRASAIETLTRHWVEGLDLPDSQVATIRAISQKYVDTWLTKPSNQQLLGDNPMVYADLHRKDLEDQIAMQRAILGAVPLTEIAKKWLFKEECVLGFSNPGR